MSYNMWELTPPKQDGTKTEWETDSSRRPCKHPKSHPLCPKVHCLQEKNANLQVISVSDLVLEKAFSTPSLQINNKEVFRKEDFLLIKKKKWKTSHNPQEEDFW